MILLEEPQYTEPLYAFPDFSFAMIPDAGGGDAAASILILHVFTPTGYYAIQTSGG